MQPLPEPLYTSAHRFINFSLDIRMETTISSDDLFLLESASYLQIIVMTLEVLSTKVRLSSLFFEIFEKK
jgi:hypothetical protein